MAEAVYWCGKISFKAFGMGLGIGRGQVYQLQPDGRWLKIEG